MVLVLKLLLTPILITLATLGGRRWGPGLSGWFLGFPLTSGPVSLILALQYGSGAGRKVERPSAYVPLIRGCQGYFLSRS